MSILIKNMEMPKRGETITVTICDDGLVFEEYYKGVFNAVPIPPHGDLIDASTKVTIRIYDDMYEEYHDEECTIADTLDQWSNEGCPKAIIPSDKEDNKNETAY